MNSVYHTLREFFELEKKKGRSKEFHKEAMEVFIRVVLDEVYK